jgi:hypothetical protein
MGDSVILVLREGKSGCFYYESIKRKLKTKFIKIYFSVFASYKAAKERRSGSDNALRLFGVDRSLCGRFNTGIRAHFMGIRCRSAAPKLSFAGNECQDAGGRSHRSALNSSARCVACKKPNI